MEPECSLPHSQCPPPAHIPSQLNPLHTPPHLTSWSSILILSYHLRLDLPSGLFPSGFTTKTLYTPLFYTHTLYMSRLSHSSWFYHPNTIGGGVQIIKLLIMYFFPLHWYLVPLTPKYSPQYPTCRINHWGSYVLISIQQIHYDQIHFWCVKRCRK